MEEQIVWDKSLPLFRPEKTEKKEYGKKRARVGMVLCYSALLFFIVFQFLSHLELVLHEFDQI